MISAVVLSLLAAQPLSPATARASFDEVKHLCERDHGRLWGVSLCGPVLLVDPATRAAIGNLPDREGRLAANDGVYAGKLPASENVANNDVAWAGVRWTELVWPLPDDRRKRGVLLLHESFHRIQDGLGVHHAGAGNAHLDRADGRLWLQLEWRALAAALNTGGALQRRAITDALLFRAARRAEFKGSAAEENALELGEGLAEYTGVRLASADEAAARAYSMRELRGAPAQKTFVRSFAYASGPAYGLLLDGADPHWRAQIRDVDDLGARLASALKIAVPPEPATEARLRARSYSGAALEVKERAREQQRLAQERADRARLVEGPVLRVPNEYLNIEFDPREVRTIDGAGTVYPTLRATGDFGVLTASGGALVDPRWSSIVVPAPGDPRARPLTGPGWSLELAPGYSLAPGDRAGDFDVRRAR